MSDSGWIETGAAGRYLRYSKGYVHMSFLVVLRKLRERWLGGRARHERRRRWAGRPERRRDGLRPSVESLEDRTLMSVLPPPMVTSQAIIDAPNPNFFRDNTPAIAVDPANPQGMVAVYTSLNITTGTSSIQGSFSSDGGLHWQSFGTVSVGMRDPTTPGATLPLATNASVAFDHAVSINPTTGSVVNAESFYVVYVVHRSDNAAGAVMLAKYDFHTGFPKASLLTPQLTPLRTDPGSRPAGILYQWAGAAANDSDPALNPTIVVDANLPPIFPDPSNPLRKVSFIDPQTNATQTDNLIVPLIDNSNPTTPNYGKPILDSETNAPVYQGQIYVAWNTNDAITANRAIVQVNRNAIKVIASSDGGQTFTTGRFADVGNGGSPDQQSGADALPRLVVSQGSSSDKTKGPAIPIQSITSLGQTATVTTPFNHGLRTGQEVIIAGGTGNDTLFNGTYPITVTGATTFTYTLAAPAATQPTSNFRYTQPRVQGGQLSVVWDNFAPNVNQIRTNQFINGGSGAVATDNSPQNQNGSGFHGGNNIIDAEAQGNGLPDRPEPTIFTQTVNIQDPNFTTASNLNVTVNISHANDDQLRIRLLPEAKLSQPDDLTINPTSKNIFVTSKTNNSVLEYDGRTGTLLAVFVPNGRGGLDSPTGLVFGPDGDLYVSSSFSNQVLRYDTNGNFVDAFVTGDPNLMNPTGLAFDQAGDLFVSSAANSEILVYQGPLGALPGSPLGIFANSAQGVASPTGLAFGFGSDHDLYIGNTGGNNVLRFQNVANMGIADPAPGQAGAVFATANLSAPTYLTFGQDADLYVSSTSNNQVVRFYGAVNTGPGSNTPRPGTFLDVFASGLDAPRGLEFEPDNNGNPLVDPINGYLFVLNSGKTREVLRFTPAPGIPDPSPANQPPPGVLDATFVAPGSGSLSQPRSMIVRSNDNFNILLSSFGNNSVQRYNSLNGGFAGTYIPPNLGGLIRPWGLAEDSQGNVYVSSFGNNRILEYKGTNAATFVGIFVGPGATGPVNPTGLIFDASGNLLVSSSGSNQILRYDSAGNPKPSPSFPGTAIFAQGNGLMNPTGLAFDPSGNLMVSSAGSNQILRFDGTTGTFVDVFASSTTSPLSNPQDFLFGGDGTVYITSQGNNRVLRYRLGNKQYLESIVPLDNVATNNGGLSGPTGIASRGLGEPDLIVASFNTNSVMHYTGTPAQPRPSSGNGGAVFVASGGGAQQIVLLNNHTNADGSANPGVGITAGVNMGIWANTGAPVGTTFDDQAYRSISDTSQAGTTSVAPFSDHFRPEGGALTFVIGQIAASINSDWTLEVTDFRDSDQSGGADPIQFLQSWSLDFTSRLNANNPDRLIAGGQIPNGPVLGNASEDGSTIDVSSADTIVSTFPNSAATAVSPNRGIGATPTIAADNTLGSFSPYQSRLYVAYVGQGGGAADNTDVFLSTSDDGGNTWLRTPLRVNDDTAADNFSEGNRPQFDPSIAVDQTTGTLVLSFYDARHDAAHARAAMYVATSINGGWRFDPTTGNNVPDFAPETYVNDSEIATDAVTGQSGIKLEPIPDNARGNATFNFGDHQGLAVANGLIYPIWTANKNTDAMNIVSVLHTSPGGNPAGGATIADGPRIVSSTEGPVQSLVATTDDGRSIPFNNTYYLDGTQQVNGFLLTFDRPIDVSRFVPNLVQVVFRDTVTPAGTPPTALGGVQVFPLDGWTTRYGPNQVGGIDSGTNKPILSTRFLITFTVPANLQGRPGTYSYAINPGTPDNTSPGIFDKIRTNVVAITGATSTLVNTSDVTNSNLRVPPQDTGGDGPPGPPLGPQGPPPLFGFDPRDTTFSTITVTDPIASDRITHTSVTINLNHQFDSDLLIDLIAPDGTLIPLSTREGGSGQNFLGTTFDDSATVAIGAGAPSAVAPFTGTFRPESPLAALTGKVPSGIWRLAIDDVSQAGIGNLVNWTLSLQVGSQTTTTHNGNAMDQNGNAIQGEQNNTVVKDPATGVSRPTGGDVYSIPNPVNNGPIFVPGYDNTSLPLIVPGPHIVSSFVPGLTVQGTPQNPPSFDNLVLNQSVHFIDVTFDRDMDPSSISGSSVQRLIGPIGDIPVNTLTITPDPNPRYPRFINGVLSTAPDPDSSHPRTYRINLPDRVNSAAGTGQDLSGTYTLSLDPTVIKSEFGDLLDTNLNAGLALLRGAATNPAAASFSDFSHTFNSANDPTQFIAIPPGKTVDAPLGFGPEDFLIQKALVQLTIQTPNDPDLEAQLVAPDGTTVQLFTNVGNNGTHSNFTNTIFVDTTFDPATGRPTQNPIQQGVAPFNSLLDGAFNPQKPLNILNGKSSFGTWRLRIKNDSSNNTATLTNWALTFTEAVPGTGLGEKFADQATVNFRIFTQDPANPQSHLTWTAVGPASITTAVTPQTINSTNSTDVTHTYSGPAVTLSPGTTQRIPLNFGPENFPIQRATLRLNINFPNDPDLVAKLIAPDGTVVPLFTNVGQTGGAHFANTQFDDFGRLAINVATNQIAPFYSLLNGAYSPEGSLATLNNRSSSGTWFLQITNTSANSAHTGQLTSWSLTLTEPLPSNSGRVTALATDPSDPSGNTVYLGAPSGGIWRTTNFLTPDKLGPTWVPLTDFGPNTAINISSIAVFPRNNDPRQSFIFATTGEGDTGSQGVGIIRSLDGGAHWTLLDSTNNTDSTQTAQGVITPINSPLRDHLFLNMTSFKVVVDPTPAPSSPDDVIVYAAFSGTNGGLWRSLDSGRHWRLMTADNGQPATGTNATDVILAPATISVSSGNLLNVYAAFAGVGVFVSTNQGTNLRLMAGGVGNTLIRNANTQPAGPVPVNTPAGVTPNGAKGRIVLAVPPLKNVHFKVDARGNTINPPIPDLVQDAQDPQNLVYQAWVYAAVATPGGQLDGIYYTKDTGANWTKINVPVVSNPVLTGIPTNDENQPNHDPTQPVPGVPGPSNILSQGNANFTLSMTVDPLNPSVIYVGGLDNIGILKTPRPAGGLIRIDATQVHDAHNFTAFDNDNPDGGLFRTATTGDLVPGEGRVLQQNPDGSGNVNVVDPLRPTPYLNLIADPNNPFLSNSTILVRGPINLAFNNDGQGALMSPYISAVGGPTGFEQNGDLGINRIISFVDPLTGHTRLVFGTTLGVFSVVDQGNGNLFKSLGDTEDLSSQNGNVKVTTGSRNGNLQITQFYDGTAQPSVLAAEIAGRTPGSGGMFYGNARDNGFPVSDPHVLDNGKLLWSGPLGSGTGLATDQLGTGNAYSYQWPGPGWALPSPSRLAATRSGCGPAGGSAAGHPLDHSRELLVGVEDREARDPERVSEPQALLGQLVDRADENVGGRQDGGLVEVEAMFLPPAVAQFAGGRSRVGGDHHRAQGGIGADLDLREAVFCRPAHDLDLAAGAFDHASRQPLGRRGGAEPGQADHLRLPAGDRQQAGAAATDQKGRMRGLHRLGPSVEPGDPVVPALESQLALAEQAFQYLDRLDHPVDAHSGRVEIDPGALVLRPVPAGAEPDLEPAAAEHVEGGQFLRQHGRVAQVVVEHKGADPDPLGGGCHRGQRHQRRRLVEEVVGDLEDRVAEGLGAAGVLDHRGAGRTAAAVAEADGAR